MLGGGNEVGRSCHILQYKGKTVMVRTSILLKLTSTNWMQLDAGMHPAYEGLSAMPFYDDFDLSTVDVLLISQYVYTSALRSSIEVGGPGVSLQSYMHGGLLGPTSCISETMEYHLHIQFDSGDVPPHPGPHVHSRLEQPPALTRMSNGNTS